MPWLLSDPAIKKASGKSLSNGIKILDPTEKTFMKLLTLLSKQFVTLLAVEKVINRHKVNGVSQLQGANIAHT